MIELGNAARKGRYEWETHVRYPRWSNDPNEIPNVKQKSLKKIKYCQRNSGFKFWPEVKITCLIDIFSAVFSN